MSAKATTGASTPEIEASRAAAFARLTSDGARAAALGADLAGALAFLAPLRVVRPAFRGGAVGVGAGGMPLRADEGPAYAAARPLRDVAPATRAGFVLVPRLAAADGRDEPGVRSSVPAAAGDVFGDDALAYELELGA